PVQRPGKRVDPDARGRGRNPRRLRGRGSTLTGTSRTVGTARSPPGRTLGRRATAGGDCPCAHLQAEAPTGRRTDREPGPQDGPRRRGVALRFAPPGGGDPDRRDA